MKVSYPRIGQARHEGKRSGMFGSNYVNSRYVRSLIGLRNVDEERTGEEKYNEQDKW